MSKPGAHSFNRRPRRDDRRRVLVEPVRDRLSAAGDLFGSARRSLARLFEACADRDLAVIADFLDRNAERLREEGVSAAAGGCAWAKACTSCSTGACTPAPTVSARPRTRQVHGGAAKAFP